MTKRTFTTDKGGKIVQDPPEVTYPEMSAERKIDKGVVVVCTLKMKASLNKEFNTVFALELDVKPSIGVSVTRKHSVECVGQVGIAVVMEWVKSKRGQVQKALSPKMQQGKNSELVDETLLDLVLKIDKLSAKFDEEEVEKRNLGNYFNDHPIW